MFCRLLPVVLLMGYCSSTPEVVVPVPEKLTDNRAQEFFDEPARSGELFRVWVSSSGYERRQISGSETITITDDPNGDKAMSEDLIRYDKVDFLARGILRIELFPDSGQISRIRFVRPSGVSEIDKILSEDVTRWQFRFPKDKIEPTRFEVSYSVLLVNRISRETAREELKKFAR